ncbi:MAG: hypothetical protein M1445_08820 [Bacteroidetes bacterium]|nr:hypothetical protein [Bacteroidota bacterium]
MAIRTFWTLFLKILGIWLILSGLTIIPQFLHAFTLLRGNHLDNLWGVIYIFIVLLLTMGLYLIVPKLLVFNSGWIIDKLKLDKGFREEKIDLSITQNTMLTIAAIVIGGFILVDALPMLCKQIFTFIQQKTVFREDPQFSWIIFYSIKTLIGYLLMTNSKYVIDYIHKKTEDIEN